MIPSVTAKDKGHGYVRISVVLKGNTACCLRLEVKWRPRPFQGDCWRISSSACFCKILDIRSNLWTEFICRVMSWFWAEMMAIAFSGRLLKNIFKRTFFARLDIRSDLWTEMLHRVLIQAERKASAVAGSYWKLLLPVFVVRLDIRSNFWS